MTVHTLITDELVADMIRRDTAANGAPDSPGRARDLARAILNLLSGDDEQTGPLDEFKVRAMVTNDHPYVIWHCPRDHDEAGKGHVGIIARDLDLDQSGLTLGEIVQAALNHEREAHAC